MHGRQERSWRPFVTNRRERPDLVLEIEMREMGKYEREFFEARNIVPNAWGAPQS